MDAKEYVKERERMLNSFGRTDGNCSGVMCYQCPLCTSAWHCIDRTVAAVDVVEAWSNEHPEPSEAEQ